MNKYEALIHLWNATNPLGLGFIHSSNQPTLKDAKEELAYGNYVDYFFGKPIKTNFENYPILDSKIYDRDAGKGVMERVAKNCYENKGPSSREKSEELKHLLENDNLPDEYKINLTPIVQDSFSSTTMKFYEKPKNNIREGLEHYTEKIDFFFKNERKGRDTITVKEFEHIFNNAEKKYFEELPESVIITTNLLAPVEVRMMYILNRWTS